MVNEKLLQNQQALFVGSRPHLAHPVRHIFMPGLTHYETALAQMETAVAALARENGRECVFFLQHPPLYTAGTSTKREDLLDAGQLPVFRSGRGGELTYHGPGQRVIYLMLDLKTRTQDIRAYVRSLENWIIDSLALLDVQGERREGRVGIWVRRPDKAVGMEDKIAAIGIRVRKWITFHGISINVDPDLSHYGGIVPCGISKFGVTSLADLRVSATMAELDEALLTVFPKYFGPVNHL